MKVLVFGAGRMGHGAVYDLIHNSPAVEAVTIADYDLAKAVAVAADINNSKIKAVQIDVSNYTGVVDLMRGHDAAISCVNYWYNLELSKAAIETKTNFCDLGGNNYVVDSQLALNEAAQIAGINIIPDCGLAPGMVSVLAMHGANRFVIQLFYFTEKCVGQSRSSAGGLKGFERGKVFKLKRFEFGHRINFDDFAAANDPRRFDVFVD